MDADGGCGGRAGKMKAVKMGGLLTSLSRARERWSSPHNRSAPRRELGHLSRRINSNSNRSSDIYLDVSSLMNHI